jgi:hypothetical protein
MVFDRGQLTWEWLPQNALRSTAHPLLYASVFSLLKQLKLDSNLLIRWLPFFLQALVFSIADVFYLSAIKNYFRQNPRSKVWNKFRNIYIVPKLKSRIFNCVLLVHFQLVFALLFGTNIVKHT